MESEKSTANKRRSMIYDIVVIAISAALITVCSWISIPLGPVPFTLQTLAILAVLLTLGGRRGTIAIVVYLALGAIGVPVFAGFKGGPAALLGPTGGFLVGFIAAALIFWLLEKLVFARLMSTSAKRLVFGLINSLIFELVLYVVGVIWFMTVYAAKTGPIGLGAVLSMCVIPFIIPDIVKMIAAAVIGSRAYRFVRK
ncbi:MAG: biotin transporter BioY [Clostridiales bacterium]|nr:biotin transporter BioY [Clostridiales bacterium]